MATNTFNSTYHHHKTSFHTKLRPHYTTKTTTLNYPYNNYFFLKPKTSISITTHPHSTVSASSTYTTTTSPSTESQDKTFDTLNQHLSTKNYREADEETRRLLIILAGEAAEKRGYVFFSEVQFIPAEDLKAIDCLWRKYSDDKFGYSVQKRIWMNKADKDFTKFFVKVAWMKKLEGSEVVQYNYRAFPNEFLWEMEEETPEGHLPLTNALRGTQLLQSIFMHPAFDDEEEVVKDDDDDDSSSNKKKSLSSKIFKTSYTF